MVPWNSQVSCSTMPILDRNADRGTVAMSTPSRVMRPRVQLVEPHDQVDQRGLAGPGRPDDGHGAARLGHQREVSDQRLSGFPGFKGVVPLAGRAS